MLQNDKERIKNGALRDKKRFCIMPFKFRDKVYWFQRVTITEKHCHGVCGDFWAVVSVVPVKSNKG